MRKRTKKIKKNKRVEKKEQINKMGVKRKKQANCGSKAIRSPKAASWAIKTQNLGPAGTSIGFL